MVVDFGNVKRVYGSLEAKLEVYVRDVVGDSDLEEEVSDLVHMGNLRPIEYLSTEQIESTLRYLVETANNFEVIEHEYDATVLMTILMEYKIEWLNGTPIYSNTWGGFVSSYENMFTV